MAITFIQEKKKQRYLLVILGAVVLSTLAVIWWSFSGGEMPQPAVPQIVSLPEVVINFDVLKSPQLEELQAFEEIPAFEDKIGRNNPFTPY